jgi:molybdopterin molybdotransferase
MHGFSHYTRLNDALETVLSKIERVGAEEMTFTRARGQVLAEDVVSEVDVPPFDRAAVDGYAVRASDTFGTEEDNPVELRVVGAVEIGKSSEVRVGEREAVKIMTGAPLPEGADAALMVEHTRAEGESLKVLRPLTPGKNVSARGEDVKAGQTVLCQSRVLRPQDVGMLASIGRLRVRVVRKPGVAIIVTGDELREPGERLEPGQITDTNSYSLEAAVVRCGGVPVRLGAVPDEFESIKQRVREASRQDMVLISGGTSVGERDLAPDVISELGELLLHGIAIRPGGPTAFGVIEGTPIFALAGFSVASLVAFDMLVRPALRAMQGLPANRDYPQVRAKLTRKVSSSLGRADVVRVQVRKDDDELIAQPIRITGSGILSSMTRADGFVVVPEDLEGLEEGREVEVELYE